MLNTMSLETIPSMSKPAKKEKAVCRPSHPHCVVGQGLLTYLLTYKRTLTVRRERTWPKVTIGVISFYTMKLVVFVLLWDTPFRSHVNLSALANRSAAVAADSLKRSDRLGPQREFLACGSCQRASDHGRGGR